MKQLPPVGSVMTWQRSQNGPTTHKFTYLGDETWHEYELNGVPADDKFRWDAHIIGRDWELLHAKLYICPTTILLLGGN